MGCAVDAGILRLVKMQLRRPAAPSSNARAADAPNVTLDRGALDPGALELPGREAPRMQIVSGHAGLLPPSGSRGAKTSLSASQIWKQSSWN